MIHLAGVSFRYKSADRYAIEAASCEIESEGISVIVGASGVGKSTLLALLAGIYVAGDPAVGELTGEITLDGLAPDKLRGARVVSWVPQTTALLDHFNVGDNVTLPLKIEGRKIEEGRCMKLLDALGMLERRESRPRQLSGGMKTRVSLARALISKPKYLFLDEPFANLDIGNRWNIYKLISEERQSADLCTLMTTHDIPEAMLLADRVIVITQRGGRTLLEAVPNIHISLPPQGGGDECLAEARRRAQGFEARIFTEAW